MAPTTAKQGRITTQDDHRKKPKLHTAFGRMRVEQTALAEAPDTHSRARWPGVLPASRQTPVPGAPTRLQRRTPYQLRPTRKRNGS